MIDRDLIEKLHDKKIINKNNVLWWQLGYGGRKVLSEEKFRKGLRELTYHARDMKFGEEKPLQEVNLRVWVQDNVPILIKDVELSGINMPCFITCCPMSHRGHSKNNGWQTLASNIEFNQFPTQGGLIYNQPHIRGVAIETTKDHLFWTPFYFGRPSERYGNHAVYINKLDTWLIPDAVDVSNFSMSLIEKE